jgi:hypothetical protein
MVFMKEWFSQKATELLRELPEVKPGTKKMVNWGIEAQTLLTFKAMNELCEQKGGNCGN